MSAFGLRQYVTVWAMLQNLAILRCPEDGSTLSQATPTLVDQLNAAVRRGRLTNRAGNLVTAALDGGLIRADGRWLYPIIDGIPMLLRDEAIDLTEYGEAA